MKLTIKKRLSLCFEILTKRSGHNHSANVKQLSLFKEGYVAGFKDKKLDDEREQLWKNVERLIKENRELREDNDKLYADRDGLLHTIEHLRLELAAEKKTEVI